MERNTRQLVIGGRFQGGDVKGKKKAKAKFFPMMSGSARKVRREVHVNVGKRRMAFRTAFQGATWGREGEEEPTAERGPKKGESGSELLSRWALALGAKRALKTAHQLISAYLSLGPPF